MIVYVLIIAGFLSRVIPHEPNMAPVAAIALFAGVYLKKWQALLVPLAIMIGSDLVIGTHDVMAYTWGGCILASVAGLWLKGNNNRANTLAASVFTSLVFFVITNFGVWLSWYPHTGAGLTECFVKAIPFLRNTMAANLIGTIVLFEGYKICQRTFADSKYKAILLAE